MKDYTDGTLQIKNNRAKKMMLWFGIVSLAMSFAGLTSSYVVSRTRKDWPDSFNLPQGFYLSLIVIVLSSFTMHFAKKAIEKERDKKGALLLWITFFLGIGFIWFQTQGFAQIINNFNINFTGPTSNPKSSFVYLIAIVHIGHVIAALISLLVVIYNHYKQKYRKGKTLGIELAATFWHFVDFLWIYLFLFFYFVG